MGLLVYVRIHFATPTARIYIILFNFLNLCYAIPFAYLCTILFNFQIGNNFDVKIKNPHLRIFYFIVHMCHSVDWVPGYNGGLCIRRPVYMSQPVDIPDSGQ